MVCVTRHLIVLNYRLILLGLHNKGDRSTLCMAASRVIAWLRKSSRLNFLIQPAI